MPFTTQKNATMATKKFVDDALERMRSLPYDISDEVYGLKPLEALGIGMALGGTAATLMVSVRSGARQRSVMNQMHASLKRAQMDTETARRVAQRDVDSAKQFATQKLACSFLPLADSLRLAAQSSEKALETIPKEHMAVVEGYGVLKRQLDSVFSSSGIASFGEPGEAFDPAKHEAIKHESAAGPVVIKNVHSLGYTLNDRVIRAAAVTTGAAPKIDKTDVHDDEKTKVENNEKAEEADDDKEVDEKEVPKEASPPSNNLQS